MPDQPDSSAEQKAEPGPPEAALTEDQKKQKEQEIGDFITRHVLEKDSVFFEG